MKWTGAIDVTASTRSRGPRGVIVHHGTLDQRYDVTHRHGFAVTSLQRTLMDLAAVLDPPRLAAAINEAAIKGWLNGEFVRRLEQAMTGRRGAAAMRSALAARDMSKGHTRSSLETAFALLLLDARLPPCERGKYVDIGDGDLRECDAMWREQKVMVEIDYLPIHETGFVPYRDRRRDRRLTAAGWRVFRLTADDLTHHRAEVIADLRAALSAAVAV
jgi:very-short-patch-repair endonuclease